MDEQIIRITGPVLKVLGELLSNPLEEISGAQIAVKTKLASGTLYPILTRLERAKWVVSEWENVNPSEIGRPRRRLYRLTGFGAQKAKSEFRSISISGGVLAWQ
jgi:PadR family transcriptional regulator, regulatory protein PadR